MRIVIPKSADGCTYTITTRHQTTAPTNLIGGGHYPLGAVLHIEHHENHHT